MPQSITYGVEIECSIPSFGSSPQDRIASDLRALGIRATSTGYSGRDYSVWQVKPDCSLRPSTGHQGTAEIVSPVLTWGSDEHDAQLRTVSEYLVSIGAKTNASCGGHVHIYVGHLTAPQLATFVESYHFNQRAIDPLVSSSRRGSGANYCQRRPDQYVRQAVQYLRDPQYGTSRATYVGGHNTMINADWYADRGTFEMRQRQASVNHYKITGWVGFLVGLIRAAEADVELRDEAQDTEDLLSSMVLGDFITPVLRDWVLGSVPRVNTLPQIVERLTVARAAASQRVSRLMRLQGIAV